MEGEEKRRRIYIVLFLCHYEKIFLIFMEVLLKQWKNLIVKKGGKKGGDLSKLLKMYLSEALEV